MHQPISTNEFLPSLHLHIFSTPIYDFHCTILRFTLQEKALLSQTASEVQPKTLEKTALSTNGFRNPTKNTRKRKTILIIFFCLGGGVTFLELIVQRYHERWTHAREPGEGASLGRARQGRDWPVLYAFHRRSGAFLLQIVLHRWFFSCTRLFLLIPFVVHIGLVFFHPFPS